MNSRCPRLGASRSATEVGLLTQLEKRRHLQPRKLDCSPPESEAKDFMSSLIADKIHKPVPMPLTRTVPVPLWGGPTRPYVRSRLP